MGWMSYPMHKPVKDWFIEQVNNDRYEVMDVALVNRMTMYAAIKDKETGEVHCHVNLIRWSPRSEYNFSYKPISEFCGPGDIDCPLRILNLLTPLDDNSDPNGYARKWREKVSTYWKKRKSLNGSKVVVRVNEPIGFTNGMEYIHFTKHGNKIIAGVIEDGHFEPRTRVRINLAKHDFKILKHVKV